MNASPSSSGAVRCDQPLPVGVVGVGDLAGDRVGSFRGGQCVECGGQHRAVQGGDLEGAVAGALAVVEQREHGAAGGVGLLAFEPLGELGVGGVGVQDVQQVSGQQLERLGVVGGGQVDQVRLGLGALLGGDPGREGVAGGDDHLGLRGGDPAGQRRRLGELVGGVEPFGDLDQPVRRPDRGAGGLGEPGAGRGGHRGRLGGHVHGVGVRQQAALQGTDPGLEAGELGDRGRGCFRGQLRDVHPAGEHLVEDLVRPLSEPHHRVRGARYRGSFDDRHAGTLRPVTDMIRTMFECCGEPSAEVSINRRLTSGQRANGASPGSS